MMGISGRTAVVTGGARGIGRAIVRQLRESGASVAVLDIDPEVERIYGSDPTTGVIGLTCDITSDAQIRNSLDSVASSFGNIHFLVNNAGISAYYDAVQMDESDWDRVFGVDLKSAWLCARHAIPYMRAAEHGAIVNISSIHGKLTIAGMFPYAAAKAGLEGLTRSLALDLAGEGIRVNAVAPGYVRTELSEEWISKQDDPGAARASVHRAIPLGRMAEPDEIATVVEFLLSDGARAITGAIIAVDCGLGIRFAS